MSTDSRVQFAADAIMRYLYAHHESADTVEGIHEWWIDWADAPESIFITYAALVELESRGTLERLEGGHREVWRLPRLESVVARRFSPI